MTQFGDLAEKHTNNYNRWWPLEFQDFLTRPRPRQHRYTQDQDKPKSVNPKTRQDQSQKSRNLILCITKQNCDIRGSLD